MLVGDATRCERDDGPQAGKEQPDERGKTGNRSENIGKI